MSDNSSQRLLTEHNHLRSQLAIFLQPLHNPADITKVETRVTVAGSLFRIVYEALINVRRHAHGSGRFGLVAGRKCVGD